MATATLSRGNNSISIPLVAPGGNPLVSIDHGKPNLEIQPNGELDPRHMDNYSGLESYTILGRFTSSSAYQKAIDLADLIKSNSNGNELLLNVDMPEFDTDIKVAPAAGQEEALSIAYNPGQRDNVEVDLGLTRISETRSGHDQPASTPTATGSGPIQLTDGRTTVDLTAGITVERAVGRPKSVVRKHPSNQFPYHIDKHKMAYDSFELSFDVVQNTTTTVNKLAGMFNSKLRRNSLTLDFNGLYGLGAFNVVPQGSGALRHSRISGEQGTSLVPTVRLRRVI